MASWCIVEEQKKQFYLEALQTCMGCIKIKTRRITDFSEVSVQSLKDDKDKAILRHSLFILASNTKAFAAMPANLGAVSFLRL